MADYISYGVERDPSDIENDVYTFVQSVFPDWEPNETALETILTEALAQEISELTFLATDVPPAVMRYFGNIVGIPYEDSAPAVGATTWTMINNAGHTIPAGTQLRIPSLGEYIAFETVNDVTVPPGSTATAAGEVEIVAVEEGAAGSGLTGTPELLDILDFVASVALVGTTTEGVDAETDDAYLDRLTDRLQLLADRPVLPADFEIYARTIAGVQRAVAIDGYNPASGGSYNNEKMIALAALDVTGAGVGSGKKTEIKDTLEALRETNFVVNMIDPTSTDIAVVATVKAFADYDTADLDTRVTAAVQDWLSPAKWGVIPGADERTWFLETKVRFYELIEVLNRVPGVNYVVSATINGGTSDVTLSGVAPLPNCTPAPNITVT